jgi:hypothetical protein
MIMLSLIRPSKILRTLVCWGHADIGGGWDLTDGEATLSYPPLVWMVQEARRAELEFDEDKMREMNCWDNELDRSNTNRRNSVMP